MVTFLFADLVGSTALTQNLHPEEARLILGDAIARLIGVVETYGGYVKDLAGDGLLAFFGAPTAHEDDPERAIRAGLEMTEKIAAYADEVRRGWGIENFAVRVGVHTGEVVVGQVGGGGRTEFGAVGDAVNLAARIQNAAAPGTVLVTEASRRLTGDRFLWGEPLVLELKGVAHPVTAHTAISASQTGLHTPGLTPLVGREGRAGSRSGDRCGPRWRPGGCAVPDRRTGDRKEPAGS